jgi:N-acetylmuramoyl-L-alanine amidase
MQRWVVLVLLCFFQLSAHAAMMKQFSLNGAGNSAVNLDIILDQRTSPKVFILANPYRVVIDLPTTKIHSAAKRTQVLAGYRVRVGQFSPYIARIVVECGSHAQYQVQSQDLPAGYKIRIVLNQTTNAPIRAVYTPPAKPVSSIRMPFYRGAKRKIVVVIDPGHGGKDPGASGYHKTLEKHVVLAISKRLQQKINRQPGMVAVLTRDGDYFIDLRRRLDISRRYHPDIFVAIHADAFTNTQSHGASVFALSQRGATSEAARWLAEKENYSELGGVNLKGLDDKTGVIRSVLIDLSQTATIHASLKIGANVLRYLGRMTTLHNHKVEQARFVVLKSPDTPSILVETGFISNPLEEQRLASSAYQEKLSQAIFDGIYQYFRDYPPRGTQLR